MQSRQSRSNPRIWCLAKHLYMCSQTDLLRHPQRDDEGFSVGVDLFRWSYRKDYWYDEAKKLMYMIQYNAFTGPDNHGD